jgi:hypothetical protein
MLAVVYFLVATPAGWLSRLVHDPLSRRRDPTATTYWTMPTSRRAHLGAGRQSARAS